MTGQTEIHFDAEPECPGFDACPVVMCGCRFLYEGSPWKESEAGKDNCQVILDGSKVTD